MEDDFFQSSIAEPGIINQEFDEEATSDGSVGHISKLSGNHIASIDEFVGLVSGTRSLQRKTYL